MRVRLGLCASEKFRIGTSKHGAFGFQRGRSKLEGGAAPWYVALARTLDKVLNDP